MLKVGVASAAIIIFIYLALGPIKNKLPKPTQSLTPPHNVILGISGAVWASVLFGLVLLAFGQFPDFPPEIAMIAGITLVTTAIYFVPRWTNSKAWNCMKTYSLIFGTAIGAWAIGFIGFLGSTPSDLYFKIITNVIALILMILLVGKIRRSTNPNRI